MPSAAASGGENPWRLKRSANIPCASSHAAPIIFLGASGSWLNSAPILITAPSPDRKIPKAVTICCSSRSGVSAMSSASVARTSESLSLYPLTTASKSASLDWKCRYSPPDPGVNRAAASMSAILVAVYPRSAKRADADSKILWRVLFRRRSVNWLVIPVLIYIV